MDIPDEYNDEGVEIDIPEVDETPEMDIPANNGEVIDITYDIEEEDKVDEEDKDIYDNLFAETTIVGTQIYTYDIDKQLNGFNYKTDINYRVGMEESGIGSIITITKKQLNAPISVQRHHTDDEVDYYNDVAGMGYSFAAICGTKVQGVAICEPQYWNNTLAVRYITVIEDARLKGIGRQLIAKCVETAQHHGFRGLHVEVGSKNGGAVEFFTHNHFHITGTNTTLYSNSDMLKNQVGIFLYRAVI